MNRSKQSWTKLVKVKTPWHKDTHNKRQTMQSILNTCWIIYSIAKQWALHIQDEVTALQQLIEQQVAKAKQCDQRNQSRTEDQRKHEQIEAKLNRACQSQNSMT
jgi:hypothetical protein